ncbi:MAG: HIT family protein [Lachnospiraceae bacterium]|nr:HIT family protein [Lachnospiraceae bacterium]
MIKDDCIFCKIGKGEIPSATIYENSDFRVFLDVAPANRGHALIIPKDHADNIFQLDGETAGKLFSLATVVARAIKEETGCEGMNIVQNNGAVAGQTVNHFHLHLIPRNEDDGVNVTWKPGETENNAQQELAKAIRKHV